MEKLIDLYIRQNTLRGIRNTGYKKVAMSAFIDVEGVFNNTGFDSVKAAAERRHIETKNHQDA
jgi:hypothetical protein